MSAFLSSVHGIDYALSSWLLGLIVFYFLIVTAGGIAAQDLLADFPKRLRVLSILTFISSAVWMLLSAEDMTETWAPTELWNAMAMTSFGHLWCTRLVVLFILILLGARLSRSRAGSLALVALGLAIPLLSVLSGHAGSQTDHLILRISTDWIHALAVGVWSGGLWMLYVWLGQRLRETGFNPNLSHLVVTRFSHFAMASTALIIITGLLTAWLNGVPLLSPWTSLYGRLILLKILFFGAAMLAAAVNQFIHIGNWRTENELECVTYVRREVRLEFVLLIVVFAVVGFLTRTGLPGEM